MLLPFAFRGHVERRPELRKKGIFGALFCFDQSRIFDLYILANHTCIIQKGVKMLQVNSRTQCFE